jgi:hypothetical protein
MAAATRRQIRGCRRRGHGSTTKQRGIYSLDELVDAYSPVTVGIK